MKKSAGADARKSLLPEREVTAKDTYMLQDSVECCICLHNFCIGQYSKTMPCLHTFHKQCIDGWLNLSALCPECKYDLASQPAPKHTGPCTA